jgi:CRP/FNR family transcriptional regulator, dissimilatory nitrate respiration regulator
VRCRSSAHISHSIPMPDLNRLMQGLKSVPHFRGLSETDLRAIVAAGDIQRHPAGDTIYLEDEPCSGMYVLLSGEVHLCKLGPHGQQNIVSVIVPVIMFNEVAVLDGGPNPLTAMAVQDSQAWRVSYPAFQELLGRYPQLGLSLLRILAYRNRLMIAHYHDLSFLPVMGRVAKLLLELSQNGKQTIQRRKIPVSQMAARTATVSEAVSRSLKSLRQQGVIEISRASITILRPEVLANLAQVEF